MKNIYDMKEEYDNIDIPDELDFIVRKTIVNEEKKMKRNNTIKNTFAVAAAVAVIFTGAVNVSSNFSYAMSNVPVINKLAKLVTFKEFKHEEKGFESDIKVANINNLEDKDLENSLNAKYIEEGKALYDEFTNKMNDMKKENAEHYAVSSDSQIVNENDRLLVVKRITSEIEASSYITVKFDNVDKINKVMLTLPSLFKDDKYIDLISENIKNQMREQMKANPNEKAYFVDDEMGADFQKIAPNQTFYINKDNHLVIVFDQTEVAPSAMGVVEFEIPTDIIRSDLAGDMYIK